MQVDGKSRRKALLKIARKLFLSEILLLNGMLATQRCNGEYSYAIHVLMYA
jgi:hypothetical protein